MARRVTEGQMRCCSLELIARVVLSCSAADPSGSTGRQVLPAPDHVTIVTEPRQATAACPLCGRLSGRVHSRYRRTLADLPWQGTRAVLRVRARRFRCATPTCPRQVFAERLPDIVRPSARRTLRLAATQRHVASAMGGEPGARLTRHLAMPTSGDTLLRLVRSAALDPYPPPRVVGIDDWSWRRGLRYGTILCDLERGCVIDLLPDRTRETVAAWGPRPHWQRQPDVRGSGTVDRSHRQPVAGPATLVWQVEHGVPALSRLGACGRVPAHVRCGVGRSGHGIRDGGRHHCEGASPRAGRKRMARPVGKWFLQSGKGSLRQRIRSQGCTLAKMEIRASQAS